MINDPRATEVLTLQGGRMRASTTTRESERTINGSARSKAESRVLKRAIKIGVSGVSVAVIVFLTALMVLSLTGNAAPEECYDGNTGHGITQLSNR